MQSHLDQILLHDSNKKVVESGIDKEIDDFLAAVPHLVDFDVSIGDLQPSGDPDAVDRDVDSGNEECGSPFDSPEEFSVGQKNATSVYDNLKEELDLMIFVRGFLNDVTPTWYILEGPRE